MAKCPCCSCEEAYVGTLFVECPQKGCDFYSAYQTREAKLQKLRDAKKKEEGKFADADKDAPVVARRGKHKFRYRQMTFDDLSHDTLSDPDITPLATPVNSPAATRGRTAATDKSTQGQLRPPDTDDAGSLYSFENTWLDDDFEFTD